MARQFSAKRPENLKGTICKLLGYMGNHKFLFLQRIGRSVRHLYAETDCQ